MAKKLFFVFILIVVTLMVLAKDSYWEGKPEISPKVRGYFLWHNSDGWHIRWTTRGKRHRFSGKITCDGRFVNFQAISKEKPDFVKQTNAAVIEFDTDTEGGIDGIDFRVTPATNSVFFNLLMDGKAVKDEVNIGKIRKHPDSMPFTLSR